MELKLLVCILIVLTETVNSLDEKHAKEQPCFNITKTVPLDLNWIRSIKTLYYPMMSRLELYRVSADILQRPLKDIPESMVYYHSCISWNIQNGTITSNGFAGLYRDYETKALAPAFQKFSFSPTEGTGYSGTVYTTMTDNKTFLFTPFCTKDGDMAWGLGSVYPTLSRETLKQVEEHALGLGYKREYFEELYYDRCSIGLQDDDNITEDDYIDTTEMNADGNQ